MRRWILAVVALLVAGPVYAEGEALTMVLTEREWCHDFDDSPKVEEVGGTIRFFDNLVEIELAGRPFLFTAIRHRNKPRKDRVMAAFVTFDEGTSELTSSAIIKADVTVENGKDKRAKGRLYATTGDCLAILKFEAVNPDLVP